jgi:hypothetical protein
MYHVSKVTGGRTLPASTVRGVRSHRAGASNDSCLGCCAEGSNPITSLVRLASSGSKPSGYSQQNEVSSCGKYMSNLCVWVSFKSKITT